MKRYTATSPGCFHRYGRSGVVRRDGNEMDTGSEEFRREQEEWERLERERESLGVEDAEKAE